MIQGDKPTATITFTYNEEYDSPHYKSENIPLFFILFLMVSGAIMWLACDMYYNYTYADKTVEVTILGQELIEHHGMYGIIDYEYRNTVLIGNNYTTVDSMDLMAKFRPKDNVSIITTYNRHNGKILTTRYEKKYETGRK